jgi:hypothetical protein
MSLRRAASAAALTVGLALGACGGDERPSAKTTASGDPPVTEPADFPRPNGRPLAELRRGLPEGPILAPSLGLLEKGTNRFGFGLFDSTNKQVAEAPAALYVARAGGGRARGPFWARSKSLEVRAPFRSESSASDPDSARSVYVTEIDFDRAGAYEILALVRLDGRLVAATSAVPQMEVVADGPVPDVGERAPAVSTPTEASAGTLDSIETRVPPDSMHEEDFADVVGKRPVVILFATPALCQSRVCGPVVDVAEQVRAEHEGEAAFIHMEIFEDNQVEKGYRSQVRAWSLPSEPWIFALDRRGRVAARLEGAFSVEELEAAVRAAVRR